jgi:hypothetical protein
MSDLTIAGMPAGEQIARAQGDPSMLDSHAGFDAEALWQLSLDTSWLDEQAGDVDECGVWFARMGRYLLLANSQGTREALDVGNVTAAIAAFGQLYTAAYGGDAA